MSESKAAAWTKWRELVSEQRRSGQSVIQFCSQRGLSSGQFYSWKKKLRETDAGRFVALELSPAPEARRPPAVMCSRGIEVRMVRGRSLLVEPGFDAHHLRALLSVLEEA